MGKVSFIPDNKVETKSTFPKLKLKLNETARIAYIEDPDMFYVHTFQVPVIGEDGKPEKEWVTPKDKTKEPFEVIKKDFLGRPICLGDEEVLKKRGVDPDNCPACAAAITKPALTDKPVPRYSMHVAKYQVKPGTWTVQNPFAVEIVVWGFTFGILNQLIDISEDFPLTKYDLKLGPCEAPEHMQKFKIQVGGESEWLKNEERMKFVRDAFAENHTDDLQGHCGRLVDADFMLDDLKTIKKKWDIANGEAPAEDDKAKNVLNSVLNGKKPEPEAERPSTVVDDDDDDDDVPPPAATKTRARKSAAPKVEAPVVDDDNNDDSDDDVPTPTSLNFSDLTANI